PQAHTLFLGRRMVALLASNLLPGIVETTDPPLLKTDGPSTMCAKPDSRRCSSDGVCSQGVRASASRDDRSESSRYARGTRHHCQKRSKTSVGCSCSDDSS